MLSGNQDYVEKILLSTKKHTGPFAELWNMQEGMLPILDIESFPYFISSLYDQENEPCLQIAHVF